jgi:hypothetical protein
LFEFPIAERGLGILIDRGNGRLDVLTAIASGCATGERGK